LPTLSVVITSFGFHIVIPSLTHYLKRQIPLLKSCLFVGSFLPLCIYILWQYVIVGTIPVGGAQGLIQASMRGESAIAPLIHHTQNPWIASVGLLFSLFAIVTSFLGVSLSLSDFLSDGIALKSARLQKPLLLALTFVPPLLFVYLYPHGFVAALEYAGVFVALLLGLMPVAMVWRGRYKLHLPSPMRTLGGKPLLVLTALFFLALIALELFSRLLSH
jgi:tyrosine-specific transport protein